MSIDEGTGGVGRPNAFSLQQNREKLTKQELNEIAEKRIGNRMLYGWTMTDQHCSKCDVSRNVL